MKLNNYVISLAVSFAASLPTAAGAQTNAAPVCKPSPAQVAVHWEIVTVPTADWKRLTANKDNAAPKALIAAIQQGHYPTVSSPTVTTTNGVEAAMSMLTQIPFGPPAKNGFVSIGTETKLTPRVNADGSVMLNFSLRDTELAGQSASSNDPPPTKTIALSFLRTFRSGEIAIVSGLVVSGGKERQVILLTPTVKPAN